MIKKRNKKRLTRIFSIALIVSIIVSNTAVYAQDMLTPNFIRVKDLSEIPEYNSEEFVVSLSDDSVKKKYERLTEIAVILDGSNDTEKVIFDKEFFDFSVEENMVVTSLQKDMIEGNERNKFGGASGISISVEFLEMLDFNEIPLNNTISNKQNAEYDKDAIVVDEVLLGISSTANDVKIDEDIQYSDDVSNDKSSNSKAALPDLVIETLSAYSSYPFPAQGSATISMLIGNQGTGNAASSVCGIKLDGQLIGTFNVVSIQSRYAYEAAITLSGVSAGNHTVQVIADYNNTVSESNENNNTRTATFNWVGGTPDLSITSFTVSPGNPCAGSNALFQFTIVNNGTGNAAGTFYNEVLVDGVSVGTFTLSNLPAQNSASGSFNLAFPQKGSYNVQLKTDSRNNISESNENNNTINRTVPVAMADKITISGRLRYKAFNNVGSTHTLQNLSNYTVKIYDENPLLADILKATTTTDSNGNFSVTINNDTTIVENGSDIYIQIEMDNSYLSISSPGTSTSYRFLTPTFENYQDASLNLGTLVYDDNEFMEGAFNIYHWVKASKDFYETNASSLGDVRVKWSPNYDIGSYFLAPKEIHINGQRSHHYSSTVIVHEYGHYIMSYKGVDPQQAGGDHNFDRPGLNKGTAYSEAYATFISNQVRNSNMYEDTGIQMNLETLVYNGVLLPRQSIFHNNAKMEAFTGGAMHDFADRVNDGHDTFNGTFNSVNNVVMSSRLQSSIEFYNAYMNSTSSSNKVLAWRIFNQNHSAFDYVLPQVNITGNNISGYRANATDNVGVSRIEWYLNGSYRASGETYTPPLMPVGVHSIEARAYDHEGGARGTQTREDLDGNVLRTDGYASAFTYFTSADSKVAPEPNDNVTNNLSVKLINNNDFEKGKLFSFSSTQSIDRKSEKTLQSHRILVDENTDLYFIGRIDGAVKSVEIVDAQGKAIGSVDGIYTNEYTAIYNLAAGEYTININTVSPVKQVPYAINIVAVPTTPELDIPEYLGKVNTMEIKNPYNNQINLTINDNNHIIKYNESITIMLN